MEFYPYRTVEQQKERLPSAFKNHYSTTQMDRIEIDGCEIYGYFEYSFMEEKSYKEQPVRSDDGTIESLENYSTFLTPRLIIKYNMMHIEDYRNLMTLLKSKNAFRVTCYDVVADRRVTHEMYFANPQMPVIYQRYLAAMGIQDYTIELIGTNRRLGEVTFRINAGGRQDIYKAYSNETWLSLSLRMPELFNVFYRKTQKRFFVSYNGVTIAENPLINTAVSPNDIIESDEYYAVEE